MKAITVLVLVGCALATAQLSNLDLLNSQALLGTSYNNWASAYGRPNFGADGISSVWQGRQSNVYNWNRARAANSYLKQANGYSWESYDDFSNTHLGSNNVGFAQINATKKPDDDSGLHGGKLAGVIIGSVVGGFIILAGIISAILAWRRHRAKKRGTMYADYRSNYQTERRDPYLDRNAPQEYYRESHRNTLNQGYVNETQAADRFQNENLRTYQDRDVLVPRAGDSVSFHN